MGEKDTCPECKSTDVKPIRVRSDVEGLEIEEDGTWARACNACFASWGLAKIRGKAPAWGDGFYRFHHTSEETKALMNYKKDTDAKG